jgi:hypothetical protein
VLCYFLRDGRIAGVEMLPPGLSDEDAITRAHTLCSKRTGPFDGYEVWDRARLVWLPPSAETFARSLRCALAPGAPLWARRRQTDYHVAVAFARSSHLAEPVYKLAVEPDPDQAVVTP